MLIPPNATFELSTYREHRDYIDRLILTSFGVPREILVGDCRFAGSNMEYLMRHPEPVETTHHRGLIVLDRENIINDKPREPRQ